MDPSTGEILVKLLLTSLVLLTSSFVFANTTNEMALTPSPVLTASANLNKGNIQIGGGFSFTDNSGVSTYSLDPQLEYFVMDSLSVGGRLVSFGQKGAADNYAAFGLGPSASYYFFKAGAMAAYVAQSFSFVKYSDSYNTYSRGSSSIGMKYFVVPQVAFGVALTHSYNIASGQYSTPTTSLGGNFSFYY